jgi:hypothetical protein
MERIRGAVTGWLRWQLMSETDRSSMFLGSSCTLCQDRNWRIQQKNW